MYSLIYQFYYSCICPNLISSCIEGYVDFRRITERQLKERDIKCKRNSYKCGDDATCGNHSGTAPIHRQPLGVERARLHFSFTFASAERKITGSHYARHVGSFMSPSPGPSTFAISSPTRSPWPLPPVGLLSYALLFLSLLSRTFPLTSRRERREKKILFIS